MTIQLKLGTINADKYRVEIIAIMLLLAVGYAIYHTYKTLKFRND